MTSLIMTFVLRYRRCWRDQSCWPWWGHGRRGADPNVVSRNLSFNVHHVNKVWSWCVKGWRMRHQMGMKAASGLDPCRMSGVKLHNVGGDLLIWGVTEQILQVLDVLDCHSEKKQNVEVLKLLIFFCTLISPFVARLSPKVSFLTTAQGNQSLVIFFSKCIAQ